VTEAVQIMEPQKERFDATARLSPIPPGRSPASSSLYKTESGGFWHVPARPHLPGAAYVKTLCGRRLGRCNLLPRRPAATVAVEAVCVGCLRKVDS
jgi:hypothetical protein